MPRAKKSKTRIGHIEPMSSEEIRAQMRVYQKKHGTGEPLPKAREELGPPGSSVSKHTVGSDYGLAKAKARRKKIAAMRAGVHA